MDKITITQAGRAYLDLDLTNVTSASQLPTIAKNQHLASQSEENKTFLKHSVSKNKLDVASLRTILKDQTLAELNKLKEQTQQRAYKYVKKELMRDITEGKEFLNTKADVMARKMLGQEKLRSNLQTEIGKGKNYLSKLVVDYQARREEEQRLRLRLKEKVRTVI